MLSHLTTVLSVRSAAPDTAILTAEEPSKEKSVKPPPAVSVNALSNEPTFVNPEPSPTNDPLNEPVSLEEAPVS